jgi:hypothetical protein
VSPKRKEALPMARDWAEKRAAEIVDAFRRMAFKEEQEAYAWLIKKIARSLEEVEILGKEARQLSLRRDR